MKIASSPAEKTTKYWKCSYSGFYPGLSMRLTSSNSEPSRPPMAVWDEKGDGCHLSVGSGLSRNTWDYYNTVTSSQSIFGPVAHSSHGLHT